MGCYIAKTNSELLASIQIDYFDQESKEESTRQKMLSLQRKAFIDSNLSANQSFSKKALCWYDLPMDKTEFEHKEEVTQLVNG